MVEEYTKSETVDGKTMINKISTRQIEKEVYLARLKDEKMLLDSDAVEIQERITAKENEIAAVEKIK